MKIIWGWFGETPCLSCGLCDVASFSAIWSCDLNSLTADSSCDRASFTLTVSCDSTSWFGIFQFCVILSFITIVA